MKKLKIVILLLLSVATANAQELNDSLVTDSLLHSHVVTLSSDDNDDNNLPQIIMPSPTVRALCKYGEIPVSYATGVPDITIPLYTIKSGDIELPITLSYHAGGIKVDECASWVGLGWSLNAGGSIGVNIVGKADCFNSPPDSLPITMEQLLNQQFNGLDPTLFNSLIEEAPRYFQPDIFSYKTHSASGQFFYDSSANEIRNLNGDMSVKIEFTTNSNHQPKEFRIKDYNGFYSRFDKCEESIESSYVSDGQSTNVTAWLPTLIGQVGSADSLHLDYTMSYEYEYGVRGNSLCWATNLNTINSTYINWNLSSNISYPDNGAYPGAPYYSFSTSHHIPLISRITASNGQTIDFVHQTGREDMVGNRPNSYYPDRGTYLKEIVIKDSNGARIKKWTFNYGYFVSDVNVPVNLDESLKKRLKLVSLTEYGSNDNNPNVYSFEYYGEGQGEPQMPYRYSYAGKDAWGFCNGHPSDADAQNYIKAFPVFSGLHLYQHMKKGNAGYQEDRDSYISSSSGSDKRANEDYVKTYLLKKITYPAGGYTEFCYESNRFCQVTDFLSNEATEDGYMLGSGVRIKEIRTSPSSTEHTTRKFEYPEDGEISHTPNFFKKKVYQRLIPWYGDTVYSLEFTCLYLYASLTDHIYAGNGESLIYPKVWEVYDNNEMVEHLFTTTKDLVSPGTLVNCAFNNYMFAQRSTYLIADYLYGDNEMIDCHSGYATVNNEMDAEFYGFDGMFSANGIPYETNYYDRLGRKLRSELYIYDDHHVNKTLCMEIKNIPSLNDVQGYIPFYLYGFHELTSGGVRCIETETTDYFYDSDTDMQGRSVTTSKDIRYNNYGLVTQEVTHNPDGTMHSTSTRYPTEVSNDPVCQAMVNRFLINFPIETTNYHNSTAVSSNLVTYADFNGRYLPKSVYRAEFAHSAIGFTPYNNGYVSSYYKPAEYTIDAYDNGRISRLQTKDGLKYSYLWGYNHEYPIAEMKGRNYYSSVASAIQDNAQVREFTYSPQIGMTSETTPYGLKMYYSYNNMGWLASKAYKEAGSSTTNIVDTYTYQQSPANNYIKTETWLNNSGSQKVETVDYYDGLNRPVETIKGGLNTQGTFVAGYMTYDDRGREKDKWLPVVSGSTSARTSLAQFAGLSSAQYSDTAAYSTTEYDVLGRVTKTKTAGSAWRNAGKAISVTYGTNRANSVKKYTAGTLYGDVTQSGYYAEGTLFSEKTTDEDGKTLEVFKDVQGKKILERRSGDNDTYFVYKELGQLHCVLFPEYQNDVSVGKYGFCYMYDNTHGNIVAKQVPGCSSTLFNYDDADRVTFMQTPLLAERNLYRFYLYDIFGRVVVQGTCTSNQNSSQINRATFTGNTSLNLGGYVTSSVNISNPQIEQVNFYDNYSFLDYIGETYGSTTQTSLGNNTQNTATSLLTGSIIMASNGEANIEAYYYDKRGNITDTKAISLNGRVAATHNEYSYTNKPTSSETSITLGSDIYKTTQTNTYDETSDLLTAVTITPKKNTITYPAHQTKSINYDGLGKVAEIAFPGSAGSIGYEYNLHGWLSKVNGTHFVEYLYYNDTGATPCFNGNISRIRYANYGANYGYDFTYDGLNRLTNATYGETATLSSNRNRYDTSVNYDQNGNIISLTRRGKISSSQYGTIDNLQMTYNGNQLRKVTDTGSPPASPSQAMCFEDGANIFEEYKYDNSGSLVYDANKGIAHIEYDNLGYPKEIQFINGNTTRFVYSPDGTKLRTTHITAIDGIAVPLNSTLPLAENQILAKDSTDYSGNWVFLNNKYKRYLFDDGYITYEDARLAPLDTAMIQPNSNDIPSIQVSANEGGGVSINANPGIVLPPLLTPVFYYYTKDHLGNVRAVTNELGNVIQRTHYYPFGGIIPEYSTYQSAQPYKYNGKELDRMHGLDWYDYGARNYDGVLGRWDRIDPLCEKYYNISPYAYCAGNPVWNVDPDGKLVIFINGFDFDVNPNEKYWENMDEFIMELLKDKKSTYYDGSCGGVYNSLLNTLMIMNASNPLNSILAIRKLNVIHQNRYNAGSNAAQKDAAEIFGGLGKDETIKIVTHSMGGSYGKGFVDGLVKYAEKHGISLDKIAFEIDVAPFQSALQTTNPYIKTYQLSHSNDWLAGDKRMKGKLENYKNPKYQCSDMDYLLLAPHMIKSFKKDLETMIKNIK